MDEIMIKCPVTGQHIKTGIITDNHSFDNLPQVGSSIKCPHCGGAHSWKAADAWLGDNAPPLTL